MSPEAQRIAIAEACGISVCHTCFNQIAPDTCHCGDRIFPGKGMGRSHEGHLPIPVGCMCGYPKTAQEHWLGVPYYTNDLNAIHAAIVAIITKGPDIVQHLSNECLFAEEIECMEDQLEVKSWHFDANTWCEVLLRTLNLWID